MRVEKVSYNINWRVFKRGASFFIPCLNSDKARKEVREETDRLGYKVLIKRVIVEGIQGLRVWRL
jgi:hypothetical protein